MARRVRGEYRITGQQYYPNGIADRLSGQGPFEKNTAISFTLPHNHINEMISQRASSLIEAYNLSHGLQIADSLIAATALELDCELATINRKDFRFIEDLRLVDYR